MNAYTNIRSNIIVCSEQLCNNLYMQAETLPYFDRAEMRDRADMLGENAYKLIRMIDKVCRNIPASEPYACQSYKIRKYSKTAKKMRDNYRKARKESEYWRMREEIEEKLETGIWNY